MSEESITIHVQHYSTLKDGQTAKLSTFADTYRQMKPLLHRQLETKTIDIDVLNYAVTRLPPQIFTAAKIYLGQNRQDFIDHGFHLNDWSRVSSPNRRRVIYQSPDGQHIVFLLNSDSDLGDIINNLLAYQIEYLKIASALPGRQPSELFPSEADYQNFLTIFDQVARDYLLATLNHPFDPEITFINYQPEKYVANAHQWWQDVASRSFIVGLQDLPIYFVSSNSHGLTNIIGGYFNRRQTFIFDYINHHHPDIYQQWFDSKRQNNIDQVNDFLYCFAGKFLAENKEFIDEMNTYEKQLGIKYSSSPDLFPAKVQFIPLKSLTLSTNLDPNLKISDPTRISQSPSYIVNVQYPLGMAADYLLTEIINYFKNLRSVHIQGKAAILNGNIGDIQIPSSVLDETSQHTYKINNIFNSYQPFSTHISQAITNQKAACVYGTFLENQPQMKNYIDAGINIIEMESGHYLHALIQSKISPDLGIINYASDNPLVENLTKESLAFRSIESTYLPSLTILQRIIDLELA